MAVGTCFNNLIECGSQTELTLINHMGLIFRSKFFSSLSNLEFTEETESAGGISNTFAGFMLHGAGRKTISHFSILYFILKS